MAKLPVFTGGQVSGYVEIPAYETGWINCDDWTNRHLGSTAAPKNTDSNVRHNLNLDLRELIVKVLVSDGAAGIFENNAYEISHINLGETPAAALAAGITIWQVNRNELRVHTGDGGILTMDTAGAIAKIVNSDWYYNIVVFGMDLF
jgi:hypothetical protein